MPDDECGWEIPAWELHELAPRRHRYVVLIPVLNEGERIRRQLAKMRSLTEQIDIAVIDGGSSDDALDFEFLRQHRVRALAVKTGPGRLGGQLRIGLAWALREGYDGTVLIDGNDKDDTSAIPAFVRALEEGFDHVQGSRFIAGGHAINTPLLRHLAVKLIHAPMISLASRVRHTDTTNGFRAYSRRLLTDDRIRPFRDVFRGYELHYYLAIRAARLGFRIKEIPVTRRYPAGPAPTKIRGWRGNVTVLRALIAACLGRFDPQEPACAR
jgi:dolichol-phosphate mannosyltransferase